MLRKPLVNDVLRSLAFCVRTGERRMLFPILGFNTPSLDYMRRPLSPDLLSAFVCWAFSVQQDERIVVRNTTMLRYWCSVFSPEERAYIHSLIQRFYVCPR